MDKTITGQIIGGQHPFMWGQGDENTKFVPFDLSSGQWAGDPTFGSGYQANATGVLDPEIEKYLRAVGYQGNIQNQYVQGRGAAEEALTGVFGRDRAMELQAQPDNAMNQAYDESKAGFDPALLEYLKANNLGLQAGIHQVPDASQATWMQRLVDAQGNPLAVGAYNDRYNASDRGANLAQLAMLVMGGAALGGAGAGAGAASGTGTTAAGTAGTAGTAAAGGVGSLGTSFGGSWALDPSMLGNAMLKGAGTGAVTSGGTTLVQGGSLNDALKAAGRGAVTGAVTAGVGGAGLGQAAGATGSTANVINSAAGNLAGGLTNSAITGRDFDPTNVLANAAGSWVGSQDLGSSLGLEGDWSKAFDKAVASGTSTALKGGDVGDALVGSLGNSAFNTAADYGMQGINSLWDAGSDWIGNAFGQSPTTGGNMDDSDLLDGFSFNDENSEFGGTLPSLTSNPFESSTSPLTYLPSDFWNDTSMGGSQLSEYMPDNYEGGTVMEQPKQQGWMDTIKSGIGSLLGGVGKGIGSLLTNQQGGLDMNKLMSLFAAYQSYKDAKQPVDTGYNKPMGGGKTASRTITQGKYGPIAQVTYAANGGIMGLPPRYVSGPGDGVSDSIPAQIDGQAPAQIASGEFIFPARVVSALGNGSSEAGAQVLEDIATRVMQDSYGTTQRDFSVDPSQYFGDK